MSDDTIWLVGLVLTAFAAYGIGYRRGKRDSTMVIEPEKR